MSRLETGIFYEAPTRLVRTLEDLAALVPERQAAVVRELTKIHEEVQRGSLAKLTKVFRQRKVKGEICIVVSGRSPEEKQSLPTPHLLPLPDPVSLVAGAGSSLKENKLREAPND